VEIRPTRSSGQHSRNEGLISRGGREWGGLLLTRSEETEGKRDETEREEKGVPIGWGLDLVRKRGNLSERGHVPPAV